MAEALRESYGDLFTIKAKPSDADRPLIEGKFKSTHNVSPNVAKLMSNTFFALLDLADLEASSAPPLSQPEPPPVEPEEQALPEFKPPERKAETHIGGRSQPTLHYNIQIHLPATKDIEVFNAIFKALKEHLLD